MTAMRVSWTTSLAWMADADPWCNGMQLNSGNA